MSLPYAVENGWKPRCCSLTRRLDRMNKAVLQEALIEIFGGIDMYRTYYKDASTLPLPLELPTLTTMKGSRVLTEDIAFESGLARTKGNTTFNERYNLL